MDIKKISKKQEVWEFQLSSEDHTLANLIKELAWNHKGEAVYNMKHPLLGKPLVKVTAKKPKLVMEKVSKDIVKFASTVEKAFK